MDIPYAPEPVLSKEIEIQLREKALLKKEAIYGEREKSFSPVIRLIMTIVAQSGGFLLLFILGTGILPPEGRGNIRFGFDFIRGISWRYVAISGAILFVGILVAAYARKFKHWHTDLVLLLFVALDIIMLLLLVYQQGGICRSMFLPVFFLIPTAYLIAERREKKYRWRRLLILALIVSCICFSYKVARNFPPGEPGLARTAVTGDAQFFVWTIPITDWETLAHTDFDRGLFYVSLISAFVPLFQILVVIIQERFGRKREEFLSDIDNPTLDTP
jgi:hypothetical protein